MATNADLIEKINARAAELGQDAPDTDDLTNKELAKLLKGMQAEEDEAEAEAEDETGIYVATRHSICTKRGILGEGEKLREGDVTQEAAEQLLKKKVLVVK